jgi:protein phosphatase
MTDRGRARPDNEDHFLIASLHKLLRVQQTSLAPDDLSHVVSESRGFLFLVADGVGGAAHGREASGEALRAIAEYVTHLMTLYRRMDPREESNFLTELERSVRHTHRDLVSRSSSAGEQNGLATTVTMVAVLWPRAYLVQVGDSRCYRLRDGRLERMSKDQTVAQALVDAGALNPDDAERSPLSNVLSSAIGGPEAIPMTASTDCCWDDVLLLCTDGLTKHVSDAEIESELNDITSAERACRNLVSLALERGGKDNVTVVVGRLRRRDQTSGS